MDDWTRAEHLRWAKDRALKYVKAGDLAGAYASFASDMLKHTETRDHPVMILGHQLFFSGHLKTERRMRDWIEGFN